MPVLHIVVLHQEVAHDATEDDRDVLVQAESVDSALRSLGHRTSRRACSLNFEQLIDDLAHIQPDLVFNLVESLGKTDRLIVLVPVLLDALQLPYTGAPSQALWSTTSKLRTKSRLRESGLPTPDWLSDSHELAHPVAARYILKTVFEHASFGIDDGAVISAENEAELRSKLYEFSSRLDRPCFAEQYIEGREFNLSLLACGHNVQVLPPAEIRFEGFAPDKPHIVGYDAKWTAGSAEYSGTPRTFAFADRDAPLLERLCELARRCWHQFGLRGYARVDFRVDAQGQPWILEINANPCLSPDAGFAAAVKQAGISFSAAIERIVADTPQRHEPIG